MQMRTAIPRNQWYVAAYAAEIGRAVRPDHLRRADRLLPHRGGELTALADRCVHRRFPLSRRPRRRPGRLRLPRLHLRRHRRLRVRARPEARPAHRPGRAPTRSSSRTPSSGCGSATPTGPTRPTIPRAPWLADPRWTTVCGMEPIDARLRAARRQPDGPLPRDLPARRLHRHPRGRRDPDHHRGRREARASSGQPAHGRRRLPAVLRRVDRHRRAGSPAGRTSSTTRRASTCCTAAIAPVGCVPDADGSDPDAFHVEIVYAITPETETTHARLLGGLTRLRPGRRRGLRVPAREQPHRRPAGRRRAQRARAGPRRASASGYQELSINIDTGGLAARRLIGAAGRVREGCGPRAGRGRGRPT